MSADEKIKVLYIAGWGRSGTTLLDKILGQVGGCFSAGELMYIWHHSFLQNTRCGCGSSFRDCAVWRNILDEAFAGFDRVSAERMAELTHEETRSRRIPQMFWDIRKHSVSASRHEYLHILEKLYRAITTTTDTDVVIDSSKNPVYANILTFSPNIDLYLIHLIRDPRAVAFSWTLPKSTEELTGHRYLEYRNPMLSSIYWNLWNEALEYLSRYRPIKYIRIRYEDLIADPNETLMKISEKFDIPLTGLLPVSNRIITLKTNHTVWGNPVRFQIGPVELRIDERWKTKMPTSSKLLVSSVTWPLMLRYHYPIV